MEGCLKLITGLFARLITGPSVGMVDALTRGLTADITARTAAGSGTAGWGGGWKAVCQDVCGDSETCTESLGGLSGLLQGLDAQDAVLVDSQYGLYCWQ